MGRFGHHRQLSSGSAVTEAAKLLCSFGTGQGPVAVSAGNHKALVVLAVVYSVLFLKQCMLKEGVTEDN